MNIDITIFERLNIIDSCSIDNLLSSDTLYRAAKNANCKFCYTKYVEYEVLYKTRSNPNHHSQRLQTKLKIETVARIFECHSLSIDDLQEIEILEKRKKLGIGELSSIAFAKKINQCFMTDDTKARKFGQSILGNNRVQTTTHLLGWLFFNRDLIDSEFAIIITEHETYLRPLGKYFKDAYIESLRIKSISKNV